MSIATVNPDRNPEKAGLTHEEAVRRARTLAPILRERARRVEAERRIANETIEAIVDAGLARILQPRRFGGHEISHDAAFDVAVEIASACGSTGWCASLLNIHDWWLAGFPEEAQHDVWGDAPDRNLAAMVYPTGKAAPADGGYRLSGRWSFVSGVDYSHWAIVVAMVLGPSGPPHARHFLLPRKDYAIEDTWYNVGMRGTGSNDLVVGDVFVPTHRTLAMDDFREGTTPGSQVNTGPIYRGAMICTFGYALAAPALGAARGAFAAWLEWTRDRAATSTGEAVAEWPQVQARIAQTELDLDAAELLLRRNLDVIRDGGPSDPALRTRSFAAYGHAARLVCKAVDTLFDMSGARGMRDENLIQRAWRDVHAISAHVGLNTDLSGQSRGRFLLGLPRDPKVRMY
jgi:3-hydroxy-9,10-secoandrosta-1,3,5(10)-triene-9,17-dione monooxygenase